MLPTLLSTASVCRNRSLSCFRSVYRSSSSFSEYRSALSLDQIYPKSNGNFTTLKRPIPAIEKKGNDFSGFIPVEQLQVSYSKSSGPGGQNVNTVNTKVDVRFHVATAKWLSEAVKAKILNKHKNDVNKDGFLIVRSDKTRTQMLNLADCLDKLRTLIHNLDGAQKKHAVPLYDEQAKTEERIQRAARERLREKRHRSQVKADRQAPSTEV